MKKFKFKLESVLRYRKYKERLAQLELVKAKYAVINKTNQIKTLIETRGSTIDELRNKEDEGIMAGTYRIYANYIFGLEKNIETEKNVLIDLQKEMKKQQ